MVARRGWRTGFTPAWPNHVAEATEEISERVQLHGARDSLSECHRRVIDLAFYGGYRHTDIATILNLVPRGG